MGICILYYYIEFNTFFCMYQTLHKMKNLIKKKISSELKVHSTGQRQRAWDLVSRELDSNGFSSPVKAKWTQVNCVNILTRILHLLGAIDNAY